MKAFRKITWSFFAAVLVAACGASPAPRDTALTAAGGPLPAVDSRHAATAPVVEDAVRLPVVIEVRPPVAADLGEVKDSLVAVVKTSLGVLRCKLDVAHAPMTVANFVGLATGTKAWTHPENGEIRLGARYYDGLTFHRVIPDFMIQGGDPLGEGTGGPGYRFADEIDPSMTFDAPGVLAMANAGPATNGSQFFITEKPTPWLNGKHTIFGRCKDLAVIQRIARVYADHENQPLEPVVIESIHFEK